MNFFMFSKCGEGAGLLKRLQDEGNNCSIYVQEKDYSNVYSGILAETDYPEDNEIVIFDSSGNGDKANYFRKQGMKVFSASSFHDKLENDREFGLDFMLQHGIMIPETCKFKSSEFKSAINFIKSDKNKRFVFKPSGANIPCKLTYSASDYEDLINYMTFVEKNFGKEIDEFILQEFIEGAIISSEFWVGKNGFISGSFNQTIEVKKFMNDNLGPSTGCSGNIVWKAEDYSPIAELLKGIESTLVKEEYIGPIDLNAIVNSEGIFGLEWTPRFGLDAMPTLLQLINQDVGKLISDSFESNSELELLSCFSGSARLSIPPYPIEPEDIKEIEKNFPNVGVPIRGLERFEDNCYFYEIMKKDNQIVHSAGTGVIACISDISMTPKGCYDLVYEILENCKVPDKQYRTDLADTLQEMYDDVTKVLDEVYA